MKLEFDPDHNVFFIAGSKPHRLKARIFRMFKAVKSAYIASADVSKPGRMNHSLKAIEQDCVPAAGFQRSWLSVIQYIYKLLAWNYV